jgi:hypothetical protein
MAQRQFFKHTLLVCPTYFDAFTTLPGEVASDSLSSKIALNSKVVFGILQDVFMLTVLRVNNENR